MPLLPGITQVSEARSDVDIFHNLESDSVPWVKTYHLDKELLGVAADEVPHNAIFVSESLAASYERRRFVRNGIDPADFIYSEAKDDYLLFTASMDRHLGKGLDEALSLSRELDFKLLVVGTSRFQEIINEVTELCRASGVTYLGDVRGTRKAELFAGARALLLPTRLNEGCPLVIAEALMSGTPVICSDKGACPEMVSPDVGFVCKDRGDYIKAINRIDNISPRDCRDKAMRDYHYLRMAADYVKEYEREIRGETVCN